MSNRTARSARTKKYATLQQIAERLQKSANTVKDWDKKGLLPSPDALFVGRTKARAWDAERVAALVFDDTPDNIKSQYSWDRDPDIYVTTAGIAELLQVSLNTVKWWARDEDLRRKRFGYGKGKAHLVSLPLPAAQSGWNTGWTVESIWNWWNNDHPRQMGDDNRQPSISVGRIIDRDRTVAVVEMPPGHAVQIRPDEDEQRVTYLAAREVLECALAEERLGDVAGCWFIPDISSLKPREQQKVLRYLTSGSYPAIVVHTEAIDVPQHLWDTKINVVSADDFYVFEG